MITEGPHRPAVLGARAIVVGLLASALCACGGPGRPDHEVGCPPASQRSAERSSNAGYSKSYEFTTDWFSSNIPSWSQTLGPLRGQPNLRYLEVGVYEGRSLLWVVENVLTHPSSRLTGIDLQIQPRLLANLGRSGQVDRVALMEGPSQVELRKLPVNSFDIIYIDGSHVSADVLSDAVQSFELLKDGGLLIFDDYAWVGGWVTQRGLLPDQLRPGSAIDSFIAAYRYDVAIVLSSYQMILRKVTDPCRGLEIHGRCSPFGQYLYDWAGERLLEGDDPSRVVAVSPAERDLVESILRSTGPDEKTRGGAAFVALSSRLRLKL